MEIVFWDSRDGHCITLENGQVACGAKHLKPYIHREECPAQGEEFPAGCQHGQRLPGGGRHTHNHPPPTREHWSEALFVWSVSCLQYQDPGKTTRRAVETVRERWPIATDRNPEYDIGRLRKRLRGIRRLRLEAVGDWEEKLGALSGLQCENLLKQVVSERTYWGPLPRKSGPERGSDVDRR